MHDGNSHGRFVTNYGVFVDHINVQISAVPRVPEKIVCFFINKKILIDCTYRSDANDFHVDFSHETMRKLDLISDANSL